MPKIKHNGGLGDRPYPRASSTKARENQLINMAYDLVEQRMRDGTASAQEVVHFLKMGSERDKLELQIMNEQKQLIAAKTGAYKSSERLENLYTEAIEAMRRYSGAVGMRDDINTTPNI